MKRPFFSTLLCTFLAILPTAPAGFVRRQNTPQFYLVSSSSDPTANLKPLRITGGDAGAATLSGGGPIGKFYFDNSNNLLSAPTNPSESPFRPYISSSLTATGCSEYGPLAFTQGSSSNKCARYSSFFIQSNERNSQLGARLTFNWVGHFYACTSASTLDVWYQRDGSTRPGLTCTPIDLYTVPVV